MCTGDQTGPPSINQLSPGSSGKFLRVIWQTGSSSCRGGCISRGNGVMAGLKGELIHSPVAVLTGVITG